MKFTYPITAAETIMCLTVPDGRVVQKLTDWERVYLLTLPEWSEKPAWSLEHAMSHAPAPTRLYYAVDVMYDVCAFASAAERDAYCEREACRPMRAKDARHVMVAHLADLDACSTVTWRYVTAARLWAMYKHLIAG